jgi:hypothetical protein
MASLFAMATGGPPSLKRSFSTVSSKGKVGSTPVSVSNSQFVFQSSGLSRTTGLGASKRDPPSISIHHTRVLVSTYVCCYCCGACDLTDPMLHIFFFFLTPRVFSYLSPTHFSLTQMSLHSSTPTFPPETTREPPCQKMAPAGPTQSPTATSECVPQRRVQFVPILWARLMRSRGLAPRAAASRHSLQSWRVRLDPVDHSATGCKASMEETIASC